MATEGRGRRSTDQSNTDPLLRWRRIALALFLAIDAFLVLADVTGRLFRDTSFHVDNVVFGLAFGTTLTLLGLEGLQFIFSTARAENSNKEK